MRSHELLLKRLSLLLQLHLIHHMLDHISIRSEPVARTTEVNLFSTSSNNKTTSAGTVRTLFHRDYAVLMYHHHRLCFRSQYQYTINTHRTYTCTADSRTNPKPIQSEQQLKKNTARLTSCHLLEIHHHHHLQELVTNREPQLFRQEA